MEPQLDLASVRIEPDGNSMTLTVGLARELSTGMAEQLVQSAELYSSRFMARNWGSVMFDRDASVFVVQQVSPGVEQPLQDALKKLIETATKRAKALDLKAAARHREQGDADPETAAEMERRFRGEAA